MGDEPRDEQPPTGELTTPNSSELTAPYTTGELLDVDHEKIRAVLEQLSSAPLRLRSDNLVPRPWGGRRLLELKGLQGSTRPGRYGESFEVAAYPLDPEAARYPSIVEFGDGSSMRLTELLGRAGEAVLGSAFMQAYGLCLPLLPKFLDVEGLLSVQSHPPGHPEAYLIIDCDPGATIRVGFARPIDAAQLSAMIQAARAEQEALPELFWMPETSYAPMFAELLGRPDGARRLSERLAPMLRDQHDRPRLVAALERLDACYRELLDALNVIEVAPGMVVFNADPPGACATELPSAQIHCLGNPEGRAILLLEVRRPGVTHRAWDHVRFPLRELAVDEALAAVNLGATAPEAFVVELQPLADRPGVLRSIECPAFVIDHLRPRPGVAVEAAADGLPTTLHGLRGVVRLFGPNDVAWGLLRAGESLLLPAGIGSLRLEAQTPEAECVQVTIPLPPREVGELDAVELSSADDNPAAAKRHNLARMRALVRESSGPSEVLAIVNAGDAQAVDTRLRELAPVIFRADGETQIFVHEEQQRRGQLLGLLDALRSHHERCGSLDPDRVALGIMLPGKGTRLSPITARLRGIKPLFPMPIRNGEVWLDGAGASLWTWTLVCWALERHGFRGVAWKWGDEPQVASRRLSSFDYDLADVDAIRFGARASLTEDLARNKEWLIADPRSRDLRRQLRRRPLAQLQERLAALAEDGPVEPYVHIGSPAFSHLFLRHAEQVFGDLDGWLDVDGYLFEALTHGAEEWEAERERDPGLDALLRGCPDFRERVLELRRRVEVDRGHPMRIVVVDFGGDPYWGDIGQLAKARAVWGALAEAGEHGEFARALAGIDGVSADAHGNLLIGDSRVPDDGSVRGCVIIDAVIERGRAQGAVAVRSQLGLAGLEAGAVAIDCRVAALRLGRDSLAFGSVGEYLRVPDEHVHTSIVDDPQAAAPRLESWFADMRRDVGAKQLYEQPCCGNPSSFAAKFEQMRRRS